MVNKSLKVAVAALTIIAGSEVYAVAGRDQMIEPITACVGNIAAYCSTVITGKRARGDVVSFSNLPRATKLKASGNISVPAVGSKALFEYTASNNKTVRMLFASYNLEDLAANQDASIAMQKILKQAHAQNPEAKALIWVGRALPGETAFTEVSETTVGELELDAQVAYKVGANGKATFTLPTLSVQGKMVPGEVIEVDLGIIKK